jgi:acetyltransferase-like isoleucine patch superfamily enzyme
LKILVLLGQGHALTQAQETARACGLQHRTFEPPSADRHNFDLSEFFAGFPPAETEVFVALDERAVNYARHTLIANVRLAGYRLVNLISPQAVVDPGVRLMGNVHIGPGCSLATGTSIGVGSWLSRQVVAEHAVRLGACTTLHAGVLLGHDVEIGQGSTLGSGSTARAGTKVGRHCEWLLPEVLPQILADRSFYDALMPDGARILDQGRP